MFNTASHDHPCRLRVEHSMFVTIGPSDVPSNVLEDTKVDFLTNLITGIRSSPLYAMHP
jgi:hypothetical protein